MYSLKNAHRWVAKPYSSRCIGALCVGFDRTRLGGVIYF